MPRTAQSRQAEYHGGQTPGESRAQEGKEEVEIQMHHEVTGDDGPNAYRRHLAETDCATPPREHDERERGHGEDEPGGHRVQRPQLHPKRKADTDEDEGRHSHDSGDAHFWQRAHDLWQRRQCASRRPRRLVHCLGPTLRASLTEQCDEDHRQEDHRLDRLLGDIEPNHVLDHSESNGGGEGDRHRLHTSHDRGRQWRQQ